jgi:hypothetical protein
LYVVLPVCGKEGEIHLSISLSLAVSLPRLFQKLGYECSNCRWMKATNGCSAAPIAEKVARERGPEAGEAAAKAHCLGMEFKHGNNTVCNGHCCGHVG